MRQLSAHHIHTHAWNLMCQSSLSSLMLYSVCVSTHLIMLRCSACTAVCLVYCAAGVARHIHHAVLPAAVNRSHRLPPDLAVCDLHDLGGAQRRGECGDRFLAHTQLSHHPTRAPPDSRPAQHHTTHTTPTDAPPNSRPMHPPPNTRTTHTPHDSCRLVWRCPCSSCWTP